MRKPLYTYVTLHIAHLQYAPHVIFICGFYSSSGFNENFHMKRILWYFIQNFFLKLKSQIVFNLPTLFIAIVLVVVWGANTMHYLSEIWLIWLLHLTFELMRCKWLNKEPRARNRYGFSLRYFTEFAVIILCYEQIFGVLPQKFISSLAEYK